MKTRITKMAEVGNALYRTVKKEEWKDGQENLLMSPPVSHTWLGELVYPIQVDGCIHMKREERNGVKALGFFRSSIVTKWDGRIAETMNSVYIVEQVDA